MRVTSVLYRAGTISIAILGAAALSLAQSGGPEVVTGAWPLGDFARELEGAYARPVTFEAPVLLWRGHMRRLGVMPDGTEMFTFVDHSFTVPARTLDEPSLTAEIVARVVEAYHQDNPGFPQYRVIESRMGFHIIPTDSRDQTGTLQPAQSVLESVVTVPIAPRTASEHVRAILDAASEATGVQIGVESDLDPFYAANGYMYRGEPTAAMRPYMLFEWGASGVSARDALIDLLTNSATTMSWTLGCRPDENHGNRKQCNINFHSLFVPGKGYIWFDRCTKCQVIPTQAK